MVNLAALLPSWKLALEADCKSHQTVDSYITGVRLFLKWCAETATAPVLERQIVRQWVKSLQDGGAAPATARSRQMALKRSISRPETETGDTGIEDTFYVTVDDSLGIRNHPLGPHKITIPISVSIPGITINQPPVFDQQATVVSMIRRPA